jgi:lantibiotic leader peptide-processing serine protease
MSFFVDPFLFWCRNDPAQQANIIAIQRAARLALREGVTLVASMGNEFSPLAPPLDLAHPPLGNDCRKLPVELPGVIGVSATGFDDTKASYSYYGVGVTDVAAPGGDVMDVPPGPPTNLVLSTWPAKFQVPRLLEDPSPGPPAFYRFGQGTSQAAAHVAGLAAVVISYYGDTQAPQNGKLRPGQVEAIIQQTADPIACPPDPTTCQGGEGYNGWYGHGRVNAFRAITHEPGA